MRRICPILLFCLIFYFSKAQDQSYYQFRDKNTNLDFNSLSNLYPLPSDSYYRGYNLTPSNDKVLYLDSIQQKLGLSQAELAYLKTNHFFVSERLSAQTFAEAFNRIYANDLPVFVSTDAILHALHKSYGYMLKSLEKSVLSSNLLILLEEMYFNFSHLSKKYSNLGLDKNLSDIELYLSIAFWLISDDTLLVEEQMASNELFGRIIEAIENETLVDLPLFCDFPQSRNIDFSQFKVRGHYVDDEEVLIGVPSLEKYFKTMMWLGRIDFFLSPPANTPWTEPWNREDVRRMNIDAFLLNEMLQSSGVKTLYDNNEQIIDYFVGVSDNLTPNQYQDYLESKNITSADQLLDDIVFDDYLKDLVNNEQFKQRILGEALFANPNASEPDVLPISFKLSGQRFIIDSEVLSNVVFDRIVFNGQKQLRMMPNALDIAFALGNNDAAFFLSNEIETYNYAPNLANMRFLIDRKDSNFWNASLYNTWLAAIRKLNPIANNDSLPFFMQTAAWHQQKINTQLGSWAQLRHDNVLYAKPSYTSMVGCSYPYSYVEPYPKFYKQLATFTSKSASFLNRLGVGGSITRLLDEFTIVNTYLADLAEKELNGIAFSELEEEWLHRMLYKTHEDCAPPYSGWYASLFPSTNSLIEPDYITVDIHTQPTDEFGAVVGKVLHAGLGEINLGVFMIPKPGTKSEYIAYTGPFFSYYEDITTNFFRMNDQEWALKVESGQLPDRPSWTSAYLLNKNGDFMSENISLPAVYMVKEMSDDVLFTEEFLKVFPIPSTNSLNVALTSFEKNLNYQFVDFTGHVCQRGQLRSKNSTIDISNLHKGVYLLCFDFGGESRVVKVVKQ